LEQYVVTVGCEYGCGGSAVGRALARNLEIAYYDRTLIDKIIEETGVSHNLMEMADAGKDIKGKRENASGPAGLPKYKNLTDRVVYIQKEVVKKLAARSSCVIIGRCSDYILRNNPRCVNVFIYAPDEVRVSNVMKELKVDEEKAKELIRENDQMLHARYKQMTGSNRGARHNRHMLIDSSVLGIEGTAEYIEEFVKKYLAKEAGTHGE
jgi:cytidylate kinase